MHENTPADDPVRLFVYGTLMRGEVSDALLTGREDGFGARYVGPASTRDAFSLWRVGWYPAMTAAPAAQGSAPSAGPVHGEVYEVSRSVLPALDAYEDAPQLYRRAPIRLVDGSAADAYIWVQPVPETWQPIAGGDWRALPDRYDALPADPW